MKYGFYSMKSVGVFILLACLIPFLYADLRDSKDPREKYGQVNTTFNGDRSCYRTCDGKTMTCYYEFNVQTNHAMSKNCEACMNGTIRDCFRKGCIPANGIQRRIMTINQQMPGPLISVCEDDRIIVDVNNNLDEGLSFHWHGMELKGTPGFDGVPMVTQYPISANTSFRYIIDAQNSGTHYYHAYSADQQSNGLFGKLDVRKHHDPNSHLYDYDLKEHSILLSDWTNEAHNNSEVPDSILINGFGQYDNFGDYTYSPSAVFYVERRKRHRFRVHNAGTRNCPFELSFQAMNMTVIAVDGNAIEPIVVDNLVSSPGERFDVVVHAFEFQEIREVFMSVRGLLSCKEKRLDEFAKIIFVDNLTKHTMKIEDHEPPRERPNYDPPDVYRTTLNHPHADCTESNDICIASLTYNAKDASSPVEDLRKLSAKVLPFKFRHHTNISYENLSAFTSVGSINNITYKPSPVPGLIEDDSNVTYCSLNNLPNECNAQNICNCTHLINLKQCNVYEFLLLNDGKPHGPVNLPIHLHGYKFQVTEMGTKEQFENGQSAFANTKHLAVLKDTVVVPSSGFVRFRFRSCNKGYWLLHSQLQLNGFHGMAAVVRVI